MSRLPDFFIAGAPKCGTTALYSYLAEHPGIFMPEFKEPHYYSDDFSSPYYVRSAAAYRALFAQATKEQRIGEASVWYLFSEVAARRIQEENPEARLIVMLRRPVDLFQSLHNQMLASLYEDERDPEKAWLLQKIRRGGERIPRLCEEPRLLQYDAACQLGAQLERLLQVFPRSQVHTILFEDLVAAPRVTYEGVLRFLGLPSDHRRQFPRVNEAHQSRSTGLETLRRTIDRVLVTTPALAEILRWSAPLKPLSRALRRLNQRKVQKAVLAEPFKIRLAEHFRDDIEILERLLKRDLADWKRSP
jgi:hypothetical protein